MQKKRLFSNIIPVLLGNMLEFYDIMIFGLFASILGKMFYNTDTEMGSVGLSYITFAIGFFFRPLGGLYFGYIADIYGRKRALLSSIIIMAFATFGIAILPGYNQIGFAATILVTVFRSLQGFSAGGEYNNAAIYLIEYNKKLKNISSAFLVASGVAGSVLATAIYNIIIQISSPDWFWRIAFAFGACISIIGLFLRIHLTETNDQVIYKKVDKSIFTPLFMLLDYKKKELFVAFIIGGFNGLIYYYQFVFLVNYLPSKLYISVTYANYLNILALVCYAMGVLLNGIVANKVGAKNLMLLSCAGYAILLIPTSALIFENNIYKLCVYQIILAYLSSCFCGVKHVFLAELFPTNIRSSGVSLGYGVGVAIFGGTAPICLNIISNYGYLPITIYISVCALVCYFTIFYANKYLSKALIL